MIKITGLKFKQLKNFAGFCASFRLFFPKSDLRDIRLVEEDAHTTMDPDDPVDVYISGDKITWYPIFITIPNEEVERKIDYNQFMYNLKNDYQNTVKGLIGEDDQSKEDNSGEAN